MNTLKKALGVVLLSIGATIMFIMPASAFDMPFFGNDNNYGYVEDNGIFAFNPWEMTDPRWYATEFTNMVNEVSDPDYIVNYQPNPYVYNGYGYASPYYNPNK